MTLFTGYWCLTSLNIAEMISDKLFEFEIAVRFYRRATAYESRDIGVLAGAACCFQETQKGMERLVRLKAYDS